MKYLFRSGDSRQHTFVVKEADVAAFEGIVVHNVLSTYTLAREVEWTTRQFVLAMKEDQEEGVGTFLEITHLAPARLGEEVVITGTYEELKGHELICSFVARVGARVIARGKTGQKILTLEKIRSIFGHD